MTVIYEQIEVNNQVLLVQFQFPSHGVKGNAHQMVGCSLHRYLGVDVWSQIFTKLEVPLEQYKADTKTQLKDSIITLNRAQLELRISWKTKKPFHKEVAYQEVKNCDLCPYVLLVKVAMVSALEKYKKQHSQELKTERLTTKPTKSMQSDSSESNENRTSNGSSSNDLVEEYVPEPITNHENIPKYTPSMVNKVAGLSPDMLSDEYTPSPRVVDMKSDEVTYTPTKIDPIKQKPGTKTDLNRNDYPEKKKKAAIKMTDLFGDLGDDADSEYTGSSRLLRSTAKSSHSDTVANTPKPQSNLDQWVTTSRSRKVLNKNDQNGRKEEVNKKRKLNDDSPAELSTVPNAKESEKQKLRKLRAEWEELEQGTSTDRCIDLKEMSGDQITDTFNKHRDFLQNIFRKHANGPDRLIDPSRNQCDFLLILGELVTSDQQAAMYRKVRAEFCKSHNAITTNHENLIWKYILPEWALNIFMDKFGLDRKEAIEQMRGQENEKALLDIPDDLDFSIH